jgi:hypothetical protein
MVQDLVQGDKSGLFTGPSNIKLRYFVEVDFVFGEN